MFKNFRIASILLIVAALLLGGGCLAMTWLYLSETKKTSELEQQLAELNKLERRHEIDKSIFDQTKDGKDCRGQIDGLFASVKAFAAEAPQSDDITIMAIKRKA